MDRRQFCHSAIAAGFAGTQPWLFGCARADTSIAAVSLDGAEIELERAAINELGESLSGPLMLSGHPQYDSARMVWNGMHDKRPALIARCMSAQDVTQAVTFARERELLVAVRGGGHSWPGKSTCDGGLVIDLRMKPPKVRAACPHPQDRTASCGSKGRIGGFSAHHQRACGLLSR